jgi:EAL domain-containing protein (putative c-di-GMP-specific phosphodiesterase class I)
MHDPDSAISLLNNFKNSGINISIDDFGTGYSSLSYLRQLPVSALKIDRTFVMDMIENSQDSTIVQSTIALAHSLDLKVIAEGVENDEILQSLTRMNCDLAQGFGICRPQPLDKLIDWLEQTKQ